MILNVRTCKKSVEYHCGFGNCQNPQHVNFLKKLKPTTGAGVDLIIINSDDNGNRKPAHTVSAGVGLIIAYSLRAVPIAILKFPRPR